MKKLFYFFYEYKYDELFCYAFFIVFRLRGRSKFALLLEQCILQLRVSKSALEVGPRKKLPTEKIDGKNGTGIEN